MTGLASCPADHGRDDRKSAALAAANSRPAAGSIHIQRFGELRRLFRAPEAVQGMPGAQAFGSGSNPDHMPVFFLDGEAHKRRRQAIAQYFAPKAITGRYHDVINQTCDAIIADLRRDGSGPLDILAFQLAVDVTADVIGLTESDSGALARRLRSLLDGKATMHPNPLIRFFGMARMAFHMRQFYRDHVQPAVSARRADPREDVVSHMIRENYSKRAMLLECMIYGTAGMVTTRELITMACWHMLEDDKLRQRYLDGSEDDQFAIVEEILRLEPVAGMLYRKVAAEDHSEVQYTLDIRAANFDEEVTGPCPFSLDPDRPKRAKANRQFMSFGDGPHRCPGAQLALHEARIFLDKVLRLPGIRLVGRPRFEWSKAVMGYELRDAFIACDKT
jgi:cytochrome P450